jgi:hypothetical protein
MTKCLLFAAIVTITLSGMATAQATDPYSGHSPDVFLDNHRPLLSKKEKAPTSRRVTGKVVNDAGQPLRGALVTLTDNKSGQKTTVITKGDGRYAFDDLSFTIDYQLQARYKDQTSDSRKLSQYDRSANIVRILEVGPQSNTADGATAVAEKETSTEPKK